MLSSRFPVYILTYTPEAITSSLISIYVSSGSSAKHSEQLIIINSSQEKSNAIPTKRSAPEKILM
jgi:hypothetical protein